MMHALLSITPEEKESVRLGRVGYAINRLGDAV